MMENLRPTIILVSFLCIFFVKNVTGVLIDINPDKPMETIDSSVTFSCTLGPDASIYKEVYVLDIVKDNSKQIAVLRSSGITFKHGDVEKRYQANGELDVNDVSQTYLNLTLLLPRVEDSGYYGCLISYLDADGIPKQDKYTSRLVVKKVDENHKDYLKIMVNSLVRRVESLETEEKQTRLDKNNLQAEIQKMNQANLITRIGRLESKVNYKSMFTATIKEKNARVPLGPSKVIVFDDVLQSEGQDYDIQSGTFTANRKGLYEFHLTLGTWSQRATLTDVNIKVNGQAKASLQTTNYNKNNGGNQDQTEVSLAVVLNAGDEVHVMTSSETGSDEQLIGSLCMFGGYLVRTLD